MKRKVRAGDLTIEYTLIQTTRRDILIRALEGGLTRVYAPRAAHLSEIDELVRQNAEKLAAMAERLAPRPLKDGDCVNVEGRPCRVTIRKGRAHCEWTEGELTVTVPDPEDSEKVRTLARECLSELALKRIRDDIGKYLPKVGGGPVGRVTVRAQRSRWGSCSSKHNLSFNWRLILAPPQCLDYVVIHELCHLTEFNHSPRFWAMVEKQMPDYTVWKEYLKKNGQGLNL